MKYYVYTLSSSNGIFYVGKGTGPRMYDHAYKARRTTFNHPTLNKIRKLWNDGDTITYNKVAFFDKSIDALDKEKELIEYYGLDNLTNITSGGEGRPNGLEFSKEHRKKISLSVKKAIREGRLSPGRFERTEEYKKKISKSSKFRMTKEERLHLSEMLKSHLVSGKRILSDIARKKMSDSAKKTNELRWGKRNIL